MVDKQAHLLHQLAAAAGAREYAERSYRELVVEAAKRYSIADVTRAAGVSRQAVHSMLKRAIEPTRVEPDIGNP
jgi:DNA-directed RNA polymerase sigma subunit (sigma70/sigma32)